MNDSSTTAPASTKLEKIYDTKELATYLGVSNRTVEGWRRRGEGPNYTVAGGRRVVYTRSEIARWQWDQSRDGRAASTLTNS